MIYVVGSGPAGVSVSYALLKRGVEVTMLDVGLELEPERSRHVEALFQSAPDEWSVNSLAMLKGNASGRVPALPRKLSYGSDFPYRDASGGMSVIQSGVEVLSSCARGGLSNVWGSAVLPYRPEDISDWPITVNDLAPHYRAAFDLMPLAAQHDDLASEFPMYASHYGSLELSSQAGALIRDMDANRDLLLREGIRYGRARLAVHVGNGHDKTGCVYCAMCLYGCPRKLIYNSVQTLEILQKHQAFHYRGDVSVDRVVENSTGVQIHCRRRPDQLPFTLQGERVYVGAGILGTAKIMLASSAAYDRPLTMKGSQYFLQPLLRLKGTKGVTHEPLHTLAQIFLEIRASIPGGRSAHLQAYTYNDLYQRLFEQRLAVLGAKRWSDSFLGRLIVLQGYLHSDDSSTIVVRLAHGVDADKLMLEAKINPQAKRHVKSICRKLLKCGRYLRMMPLLPLRQIGKPGEGSHIGGTFPMRRVPGDFETDVLGRVNGMRRVHIVDASVFPSIPSTTITLSVMANAHRIGSLYARESAAA